MKVTLKLNRVGMIMEEATLLAWSVQPGDEFSKIDVLYETEKVGQESPRWCRAQFLRYW